MTQDAELFNKVNEKVDEIKKRLDSYKEVEASLSKYTLLETLENLQKAGDALEDGFVKDACEDVDNVLMTIL